LLGHADRDNYSIIGVGKETLKATRLSHVE